MSDHGECARRSLHSVPIDIPKMRLPSSETIITIEDDCDLCDNLVDTGTSKDMSSEQDDWFDGSVTAGDTEEENARKVTTADACVNTDFDGTFSWSASYLYDTTSSPGTSSTVDADSYTTTSKSTLTSPAKSYSSESPATAKKLKRSAAIHCYPEVIDVTNLRFGMPKYPNQFIDHFFLNPSDVLSGACSIPPLIDLLIPPNDGNKESDREDSGEGDGQSQNEEDFPEIRRRTPLSSRLYAGVTSTLSANHEAVPTTSTMYHMEHEGFHEDSPRQPDPPVKQSQRRKGGVVKLKKGRTVSNWQDVLSVAEEPSTSDSSNNASHHATPPVGPRPLGIHSSETITSTTAPRVHSAEPIRASKAGHVKSRSYSQAEVQQNNHADEASRNKWWKSSVVKGGLGVLGVVAALAAFIALIAPRDEPEDYNNFPVPDEGPGRRLAPSICKGDPPPSPKPCVKSDWSGQPVPRGVAVAYRCQVDPEKPVVMLVACRGEIWQTTFDFLHSCICSPKS